MSDAIYKRIKQLENQNIKFQKLLESTLEITNADSIKVLQLKNESNFLKKAVAELESQKNQLENELQLYLEQGVEPDDNCLSTKLEKLENENVEIKNKLDNAMNDIKRESSEIKEIQTEDDHIKQVFLDLEKEKEQFLEEIRLIREANNQNDILAKEHIKLCQELTRLETENPENVVTTMSFTSQDLVNQIANIETMKEKLQNDLHRSQTLESSDPLDTPTENTVLELKISGLEKQKQRLLKELRAVLLLSANHISRLHSNASDYQLKHLVNELEIRKTVLLINMINAKESNQEKSKQDMSKKIEENNQCDQDKSEENPEKLEEQKLTDVKDELKEEILKSFTSSIADKEFCGLTPDPDKKSASSNLGKSSTSTLPSNSSEIIQKVTEIKETNDPVSNHSMTAISENEIPSLDQESYDLPTVSEEDEPQNELIAEHERLKREITRLEIERNVLIQQLNGFSNTASLSWEFIENASNILNLETQNELHSTFMREESSEELRTRPNNLDDATNELYRGEGQLLEQRVREMEMDNERIRRELNLILEEIQSDKDQIEVLERGVGLIKERTGLESDGE